MARVKRKTHSNLITVAIVIELGGSIHKCLYLDSFASFGMS
jgi:hypothetical protein